MENNFHIELHLVFFCTVLVEYSSSLYNANRFNELVHHLMFRYILKNSFYLKFIIGMKQSSEFTYLQISQASNITTLKYLCQNEYASRDFCEVGRNSAQLEDI